MSCDKGKIVKYNDFEAVLFDLDGVLIDTYDFYYSVINETLEKIGKTTLSRKEYHTLCWGEEFEDMVDNLGLDRKESKYLKSKFLEFVGEIKVFSDTKRVLEDIELDKAVVTNMPSSLLERILDEFDLKNYFKTIVNADDVENPKPSPEPVRRACKDLGVDPKLAIFVGDTEKDVKAGQTAGCKVVGIGVEADFKIGKVGDLISLFRSN